MSESSTMESDPADAGPPETSPPPLGAPGRGLNSRAVGILVMALLLGGVMSRVINVRLVAHKAEFEHQRHLVRVERDRLRRDMDEVAAQIAAKRAKRGLPKVDAAPGDTSAAPVQAN